MAFGQGPVAPPVAVAVDSWGVESSGGLVFGFIERDGVAECFELALQPSGAVFDGSSGRRVC